MRLHRIRWGGGPKVVGLLDFPIRRVWDAVAGASVKWVQPRRWCHSECGPADRFVGVGQLHADVLHGAEYRQEDLGLEGIPLRWAVLGLECRRIV